MADKMTLVKRVCFACSEQFPEVPCAPSDCPIIRVIKSIDPESLRPKGFWEEYETSTFYGYDDNLNPKWAARKFYRCDGCRRGSAVKSNYCPNCGADMREV